MAAMKVIVRWLNTLKEMGVYDNTRIVIVADHGSPLKNTRFEDGENMVRFNPLLMVKEPDVRGRLTVSNEFMTNADTVPIVSKVLENPVNPYLGTRITDDFKKGELIIGDAASFQPRKHGPYKFNMSKTRKLTGKDIFKKSSWGEWEEGNK
jgi:arylsulfatase A-like enzyme